MGNMSMALLLSLILLVLELGCSCVAKNTSFGGRCITHERNALLKFKASLVDRSNRLSSWVDHTDCCIWEGVSCHEISGHVIKLDLRGRDSDFYGEYYRTALRSKSLDSSLLELKHLNYLDLSCNSFENSKIPAFLGSIKQLQYLNLSSTYFSGIIPHQLGNLSSLHTLDLKSMHRYYRVNLIGVPVAVDPKGELIVVDPTWISNLSSLKYLDLSHVDLSQTKDLLEVLNTLPSLIMLRLSASALNNSHISLACTNVTLLSHVQHLDLSYNSFYGEFPCFLRNMTSLRFLDLSYLGYNSPDMHFLSSINLVDLVLEGNELQHNANWISEFLWDRCRLKSLNLGYNGFYGNISDAFKNMSGCWSHSLERLSLNRNNFYGHLPKQLGEMRQLIDLRLSVCNISGPIPTFLENLSALEVLDISGNELSGSIPSSLGNLRALEVLEISGNELSGSIPSSLGNLRALEVLDISYNKFYGPIPSSLGNLRSLRMFNLGHNQLSGEIPFSLGQLSNLESIDLSYYSFNATLSEAHFAKLSKLESFDASTSFIKINVGYDWLPPFQLKSFGFRDSNIGGEFPTWLLTQKALTRLVLANCSLSGILPKSLGGMNLNHLDLSKNNITGTIPELPSSIMYLRLYDNMISHIPINIGNMAPLLEELHLARNLINGSLPQSLCNMKSLIAIDLSKNHLSGNLLDCWPNFQMLKILRLHSNKLSGIIPPSIGGAGSLSGLNLNNNSLIGQLPSTLKDCTYLEVLGVGENMLSGEIPEWIGKSLLRLEILILGNNQFHGNIPPSVCQASHLRIVDLANNQLIGNIPHCFQNFSGMILGKQQMPFRRYVWRNADRMNQALKGENMEYTGNLEYLANLDLSCNNLVGEIPWGLTSLSRLQGLNLSHNHLEGKIPGRIGDMECLESLDLSNNKLSGKIPYNLSNLYFLSYLKLSNNNLSGEIPTGRQLQTLDNPSMYDGNPLLCGAPLLKRCPNNEASNGPNAESHSAADDEDRIDRICLYAFVIGGLATGFWGFIGCLLLKRRWRYAYFQFIEEVFGKMKRCWAGRGSK